jgi:hypothetical protein
MYPKLRGPLLICYSSLAYLFSVFFVPLNGWIFDQLVQTCEGLHNFLLLYDFAFVREFAG